MLRTEEKLPGTEFGNDFLNMTRSQATKAKSDTLRTSVH